MRKNCLTALAVFLLTAVLFAVPVSAARTNTEGDWYARMEALYLKNNPTEKELPAYAEEFYEWLQTESAKENGALVSLAGTVKEDSVWSHPVYTLTLTGLESLSETGVNAKLISAVDPIAKVAENVLRAFRMDYPEVNWLNSQTYIGWSAAITTKTTGNKTEKTAEITVYLILKDGTSYDIRTTTSPDQDAVTERAAAVLEEIDIPDGSATAEKIRALNNWLTKKNGYSTADSFTSAHRDPMAALNGKSGADGPVCEGYAKAFKVLCDQLGIPCVLIAGDTENSVGQKEAHMWNAVKMEDGKWYAVDVTWNDPKVRGKETWAVSGHESEEYLLVGQDKMTSHTSVNYTDTKQTISFADAPALALQAYVEGNDTYIISGTIAPADAETTITLLTADGEFVDSVRGIGSYTMSVSVDSGEYILRVERPKYVTRTYTITLGGN